MIKSVDNARNPCYNIIKIKIKQKKKAGNKNENINRNTKTNSIRFKNYRRNGREKFDEYAKSKEEEYTKEELMFLNHQAKKTEAYFIYNYVTDAGTIIEYHTNYCYNGKKHYYDGYGMHEYIKK